MPVDQQLIHQAVHAYQSATVPRTRNQRFAELNKLVTPIVRYCQNRFKRTLDLEDRISAGGLAVFESAETWDGEHPYPEWLKRLLICRLYSQWISERNYRLRYNLKGSADIDWEQLPNRNEHDPAWIVSTREYHSYLIDQLRLSELEQQVLNEYLSGAEYIDMNLPCAADERLKVADNALTRIRRKAGAVRRRVKAQGWNV